MICNSRFVLCPILPPVQEIHENHHRQHLLMTTMPLSELSSSFNISTALTQVFTDYAVILAQEAWKWTCRRLEVSHLVAAFIFFWWSRRQPKQRTSRKQSQHVARGLKRSTSSSIFFDDDLWDTKNSSRSNTKTGNGDSSSASLLPSFPTSTRQERQRFLSANKGNVPKAVAKLQAYLQWRHKYAIIEHKVRPSLKVPVPQNKSDNDGDVNDWIIATGVAMQAHGNNSKLTTKPATNIEPHQVPQVARMHSTLPDHTNGQKLPCLDRNGHRIIHLTPGRMEGIPLKTYATSIALYIDRKLSTHSTERVVLVIDVRGGIGWPNRNGAQLLPFMQHIIPLLLQNFPDRLAQCIVFPVPPNFEWVWKIVRSVCLDAATANSIQVVTGLAFKECPPPYAKLDVFIEERIVQYWEELRIAAFILGRQNDMDDVVKKE